MIVVIAHEPVPGRTKTRLIPFAGTNLSALLADTFLRDTIAKARKVADAVVIATDPSALVVETCFHWAVSVSARQQRRL